MAGLRLRRLAWALLAVLLAGAALYYGAQALAGMTPGHLERTAEALARWREYLASHGAWLHLGAHGLTYLYLVLRWPRLVGWVDRQRVARGHAPLSADEQGRLAWVVVTVCVAYEGLLLLRYLG